MSYDSGNNSDENDHINYIQAINEDSHLQTNDESPNDILISVRANFRRHYITENQQQPHPLTNNVRDVNDSESSPAQGQAVLSTTPGSEQLASSSQFDDHLGSIELHPPQNNDNLCHLSMSPDASSSDPAQSGGVVVLGIASHTNCSTKQVDLDPQAVDNSPHPQLVALKLSSNHDSHIFERSALSSAHNELSKENKSKGRAKAHSVVSHSASRKRNSLGARHSTEENILSLNEPIPPYSSHRQAGIIKTNLYNGSRFTGYQRSKKERYEVNVTIQYVDFKTSYLCGYLCINHLTKTHPSLTTFFEGEIISKKFPFLTRKWEATEEIDRAHWSKFDGFDSRMSKCFNLDSFNYSELEKSDYVYMRWKEHFLVPDHTIKHVEGASYAGFYYICYSKRTSEITGYYFHINSDQFER